MGFTPNQILTLAEAGFTAQQIGALNTIQTTPVPTAQQVQTTPVPTAQQVQTTPVPTAQQVQTTQQDMLSKILGAIQTNAINQTSQPERQTTDDILAEIINPPVKE